LTTGADAAAITAAQAGAKADTAEAASVAAEAGAVKTPPKPFKY
jgi:hypothetical protein